MRQEETVSGKKEVESQRVLREELSRVLAELETQSQQRLLFFY